MEYAKRLSALALAAIIVTGSASCGCSTSSPTTGAGGSSGGSSGAGGAGGTASGGSGGAGGSATGGSGGAGGTASGSGGAGGTATGGAGGAGGTASGGAGGTATGGAGGARPDAAAGGNDGGAASDGGDGPVAPVVDRAATLALMRRVADYELARFGTATNANWVRAVFYTGLMAMWRASGDAKYLTASRSWGQATMWRLGTDSANNPRWADNQACTQTYAELYSMDPGTATDTMLTAARAAFDAMVAAPMTGRAEWWWCDALFMAPTGMVRVAKATGRTQYTDLAHTMFFDTKAYLYDTTQHLFWRDNTFRNTSFWSRGNGWVVGGTARILEALPATDARRPDYETLLREMAGKLRTIQGSDGFWRSDLLNPTAFPNPESSGTAFFTFGLAWGINHGVLDRATYLDTVTKGWAALLTAVSAQGRLGWVQAVGSKPGVTNQADTNDYATGALLLAGEQMLAL